MLRLLSTNFYTSLSSTLACQSAGSQGLPAAAAVVCLVQQHTLSSSSSSSAYCHQQQQDKLQQQQQQQQRSHIQVAPTAALWQHQQQQWYAPCWQQQQQQLPLHQQRISLVSGSMCQQWQQLQQLQGWQQWQQQRGLLGVAKKKNYQDHNQQRPKKYKIKTPPIARRRVVVGEDGVMWRMQAGRRHKRYKKSKKRLLALKGMVPLHAADAAKLRKLGFKKRWWYGLKA